MAISFSRLGQEDLKILQKEKNIQHEKNTPPPAPVEKTARKSVIAPTQPVPKRVLKILETNTSPFTLASASAVQKPVLPDFITLANQFDDQETGRPILVQLIVKEPIHAMPTSFGTLKKWRVHEKKNHAAHSDEIAVFQQFFKLCTRIPELPEMALEYFRSQGASSGFKSFLNTKLGEQVGIDYNGIQKLYEGAVASLEQRTRPASKPFEFPAQGKAQPYYADIPEYLTVSGAIDHARQFLPDDSEEVAYAWLLVRGYDSALEEIMQNSDVSPLALEQILACIVKHLKPLSAAWDGDLFLQQLASWVEMMDVEHGIPASELNPTDERSLISLLRRLVIKPKYGVLSDIEDGGLNFHAKVAIMVGLLRWKAKNKNENTVEKILARELTCYADAFNRAENISKIHETRTALLRRWGETIEGYACIESEAIRTEFRRDQQEKMDHVEGRIMSLQAKQREQNADMELITRKIEIVTSNKSVCSECLKRLQSVPLLPGEVVSVKPPKDVSVLRETLLGSSAKIEAVSPINERLASEILELEADIRHLEVLRKDALTQLAETQNAILAESEQLAQLSREQCDLSSIEAKFSALNSSIEDQKISLGRERERASEEKELLQLWQECVDASAGMSVAPTDRGFARDALCPVRQHLIRPSMQVQHEIEMLYHAFNISDLEYLKEVFVAYFRYASWFGLKPEGFAACGVVPSPEAEHIFQDKLKKFQASQDSAFALGRFLSPNLGDMSGSEAFVLATIEKINCDKLINR